MALKKSGRGSVGRAMRKIERYEHDKNYRNNHIKSSCSSAKKYRIKRSKYAIAYMKQLYKFRNKKCKICKKLLDYRTKGNYCKKHMRIGRKKDDNNRK